MECRMGASGDMLMAALYELLQDKVAFRERMGHLRLTGVTLDYAPATKCGVAGTHITVRVSGEEEKSEDVHYHAHESGSAHVHEPGNRRAGTRSEQKAAKDADSANRRKYAATAAANADAADAAETIEHHKAHPTLHAHVHAQTHAHAKRYTYNEIVALIQSLGLPDNVLEDALDVYRIIGEAEAAVHGAPLDEVHLHEIGALDAVADIVGCCILVNMLGVTDITASPIHVGAGSVQCEHGILPVPAPAAAEILKGIPIYGGNIIGELCTPTGAALLKHFVRRFGEMPPMTIVKIGCGMGAKDFKAANCIRAFLCEDETSDGGSGDDIHELTCNLDDMTPEAIGAAFEILLDNGALDVYATPIMMKKNRPAVMLSCLCDQESRDKLTRLMLDHTTTLGVRISSHRRSILTRSVEIASTEYGEIRVKRAYGFGAMKLKPEYADVLEASKRAGAPFAAVHDAAIRAIVR